MAYSDIGDVSAGDPVNEAYLDQIRANFQAGPPDAFTTKGDLFVATAADAGARVAVGANDATLVADSSQTAGVAWQIQPAARVYNSSSFDPTPSTWTSVTFDSESYDTDAMHSTSTNTQRLTVPTGGDGIYSFGMCAQFDTAGGSNPVLGVRLVVNSTVVCQHLADYTNNADHTLSINTEYSLAATNYIEAQVYTSVDVNILQATGYSPTFWARWERRQ